MGLLKATTVFIGWLTGSLAGLSALLYASGYLVTRAHLRLLGVDGLLTSSNEQFIQEGADFFAVTGELLINRLLGLFELLLLLAVVPVLAGVLVSRLLPAAATRIGAAWNGLKRRLASIHGHLPWSADLSLYLVLLALLFTLLEYRDEFFPPLRLSAMLYADPTAVSRSSGLTEDRLRCWLLTGDAASLRHHYGQLLTTQLYATGLLVLAWRATASRSRRFLLVTPFLAVFALYTVYLPMLYGVLVRSTTYSLVSVVNRGEGGALSAGAPLYLLQKTANEFIVWDAARTVVFWIPKDRVTQAVIGGGASLFGHRASCGS